MNEVEIVVKSKDQSGPGFDSAKGRFDDLKKVGKVAGGALAAGGAVAGGLFAKGLADNMNIHDANKKLQGQLGLTNEQTKQAGKVAGEVYADNWGDSISDVNDAIKSVGNNIGDVSTMAPQDLKKITEGALALAGTFDVDVNDSTRAAGKLMKTGLAANATEAFDIITKGFQNGLDSSGDWLDTLNEYAPQFKKLGITGKDALDIVSKFMQAGARDTDAAADAFKEFSIRAIDGSKTTKDGFQSIGLNAKDMAEKIGKGGKDASEGLDTVIKKLQGIKDPVEQNRVGTELFGTQWEDTVRGILPKLDMTKTAIKDVDGATQKMADTVGDTASGKVETLKRQFEQWTQKMAGSTDGLGTTVTMMLTFGPAAAGAAGGVLQAAAAMKALNLSFLVSPIGIVVVAIALLVAGLIILYTHSEKARNIINHVFAAMGDTILGFVEISLKAFKVVLDGFMDAAEGIVHGAAKAFGWVPGVGPKLKGAAKEFDKFRDGVDNALDAAIDKTQEWKNKVNNMPKVVKLQGDIKDLNQKIDNAKAKLKTVPKSQQAAIKADISNLQARVATAKAQLASIKNKTVTVSVIQKNYGGYGSGLGVLAKAAGGVIGAATGGARGGLVEVGEHGRELVQLPYGSTVIPNGATEGILGRQGGGGALTIEWIGNNGGDEFMRWLRKNIRIQGGNVQATLGS